MPICLEFAHKDGGCSTVVPPVVSTETAQSDLLELTHKELEVDNTGESADTNKKLLSDID